MRFKVRLRTLRFTAPLTSYRTLTTEWTEIFRYPTTKEDAADQVRKIWVLVEPYEALLIHDIDS